MGTTHHDVQKEESLCHLDPDADEGNRGQKGPDYLRGGVYNPSHRGRNCVPSDSEHNGDFIL